MLARNNGMSCLQTKAITPVSSNITSLDFVLRPSAAVYARMHSSTALSSAGYSSARGFLLGRAVCMWCPISSTRSFDMKSDGT